MAMFKLIFILIVLTIQINIAYAEEIIWEKVDSVYIYYENTSIPLSYWFWSIDCANDSDCVTIADLNVRYPWNRVTTDGGRTWTTTLKDTARYEMVNCGKHFTYEPVPMRDISYPDTNLCIAIGDSGYYWRSTDRCRSWVRGYIPSKNTSNRVFEFFIDMYDTIQGGVITPFELFLTSDGGLSWFKPDFDLPDSLIPTSFQDIKIPEKSYIISLAYNPIINQYLIISQDFGKSWLAFKYDSLGNIFDRLAFLNKNLGWAACRKQIAPKSRIYRDIILKTTDGGRSWTTKLDTMLHPGGGLQNIYFSDSLNGYALCYYIGLWRTTDGGEFWWRDTTFNRDVGQFVTDIAVLSDNSVLVVTDGNYIYKSSYRTTYAADPPDIDADTVSFYPNPARRKDGAAYLSWRSDSGGPIEISIYNTLGSRASPAYSYVLNPGSNTLRLITSWLLPGSYFIMVKYNGNCLKVIKIILED